MLDRDNVNVIQDADKNMFGISRISQLIVLTDGERNTFIGHIECLDKIIEYSNEKHF